MKFYAIVLTRIDQPGTPVLDDAWDGAMVEANPAGIRASLADALAAERTLRAALVAIDVDDQVLLEQLERPTPVLPGTVDVAADVGVGGEVRERRR